MLVLMGDVCSWGEGGSKLGTATMVWEVGFEVLGMSPAPLLLLSLDVLVWRYGCVPGASGLPLFWSWRFQPN